MPGGPRVPSSAVLSGMALLGAHPRVECAARGRDAKICRPAGAAGSPRRRNLSRPDDRLWLAVNTTPPGRNAFGPQATAGGSELRRTPRTRGHSPETRPAGSGAAGPGVPPDHHAPPPILRAEASPVPRPGSRHGLAITPRTPENSHHQRHHSECFPQSAGQAPCAAGDSWLPGTRHFAAHDGTTPVDGCERPGRPRASDCAGVRTACGRRVPLSSKARDSRSPGQHPPGLIDDQGFLGPHVAALGGLAPGRWCGGPGLRARLRHDQVPGWLA